MKVRIKRMGVNNWAVEWSAKTYIEPPDDVVPDDSAENHKDLQISDKEIEDRWYHAQYFQSLKKARAYAKELSSFEMGDIVGVYEDGKTVALGR